MKGFEALIGGRDVGIEARDDLAEAPPRTLAEDKPSVDQEEFERTFAKGESTRRAERFGIPAQIVKSQPQRVAGHPLSDGDRNFDK